MENTDERLVEFFSKDMPFADAFKCLFENASDAIYILDKHGNFVTVNRKAEELTGFRREDFVGKSFRKIIPLKSLPKAIRGFLDVVRGKEIKIELELKTAFKKKVLVEVTSKPLTIKGKIVGTLGIVRDITERKKAQETLWKSEERYRELTESISDVFFAMDKNLRYTYWNKASEKLTGISAKDAIGKSLTEVFPDVKGTRVEQLYLKALRTQQPQSFVNEYQIKGKNFVFEINAYPTKDGLSVFVKDITEPQRMEEALRKSEEKFRNIFENASDCMIYLDKTGRILDVNEKAVQVFGGSKEELLGKRFTQLGVLSLRDVPKVMGAFANILAGKKATLEVCIKNKKGQELYLDCSSSFTKIDGRFVRILVIARDVTERKKMEEALREGEERFKTLMEEAPIGIFNTDLRGKITYFNKRFEEATGYSREEIVGKNGFKLGIMSDETLKLLTKRMKGRLMGKTSRLLEGRFKRKDGEWIWAEVEGRLIKKFGVPVGFQLIARDITERKIAEEERKRYEERLSALHTYSRDLNLADSMKEIYRLTLDAMQTVLGFEYADFFMIDKNMLCIVDQRGYPKPFPLELPLDGSKKGISIKAVKTGNSVLVQDVRKHIDFVEGLPGVLSELAVPIKIGQKILGVLNVESEELNAFDEKDQELLEILASHAATAISNLEFTKNLEMHAREIRESKEKFERFFMDNPEAAVYMDSNFHILDINPRFFKLFGYTLNEVRGKHINDIVVPKDKMKEGEKLDKKALKGYINYDTFRKRKDGSLVPVSVSVAPITVEGKLTGYITVYTDITERKRYEERLSALNIHSQKLNMAESMEEIYRLTMDAVEKTLGFEIAFFMVVDKDMLCLVDHRGYPESFSIKLPLDGTKKGVSVKVVKTGKSINVSDAEKEDSWVEFMPSIRSGLDVPVKVGGKVLGVIGVDSKKLNAFSEKDQELLEILASHAATAISNLDRAKNLEAYAREIRESQQKFERLFTDNPEAAVYMDSSFHILDINPRFSELFGYSSGEVRGKHINDGIVPKDKMEEGEMLDREALKKGYVYHDTVRKRKNGSLVPVSISAAPITVEGKLVGIVGLYKDITERKQMEKKLEEYSQHLEELVEKRTRQLKEAHEQLIKSERLAAIGQVAAMVGHDLRNPLTSIKGATYYLKKKLGPKMDEKAMEMLELVEKDVEHSNEIITDLMEYSREIRLELTETTPKSIVRDALSLVEVPENIQVLDLTQSEPKIKMDVAKMKRVFANFIKNAVEAMLEGGKLTISTKESDGNVEIMFIDTGIGMAKEVMEKIWTPFFTTKAEGMGLGLPICKRVIEAHGGKISVESIVGEGTTFAVTIPVEPKPKEKRGGKIWMNVPESLLSTTTKA